MQQVDQSFEKQRLVVILAYAGATSRLCQGILDDHAQLPGQWVILPPLWRQDGLLVRELARYSGNNGPAASRIVDRTANSGLVRRHVDPRDKRSVRVFLTRKCRVMNGLGDFYKDVNAILLDGFDDAETRQLFTML